MEGKFLKLSHGMSFLTHPIIGISVKVQPDELLSVIFQLRLFNSGTWSVPSVSFSASYRSPCEGTLELPPRHPAAFGFQLWHYRSFAKERRSPKSSHVPANQTEV